MQVLLFFWLLAAAGPSASQLLQQGLTSLMHGQLTEARTALEESSRLDPKNGMTWSALAELYRRSNDPQHARAAATEAEATGANIPAVQHALALYYAGSGDARTAAAWESRFSQSPKADGAAANRAAHWYLDANDLADALPLVKRAAALDAGVAFEWAQSLLRQQDFTNAADVISAGLQTHPSDTQLVLALGVARYGQRRFDEAITQFLAVIRLDPSVEQPYRFLGRMLDQAGEHLAEITKDCQAWAHDNPQNAEAQLVFAKALLATDSHDQTAEAALRRSIDLNDRNWEAHYQLGVLLSGRHQYPQAAEELKKAADLDERQAEVHYQLARVYDRLGEADKARQERQVHARLTATPKPIEVTREH